MNILLIGCGNIDILKQLKKIAGNNIIIIKKKKI